MKKLICIALSAALALTLAACGGRSEEIEIGATLSGTVSTDGSTSMEKVIGGLGEMFMEMDPGITFTYNPTGSGSGIKAVQEGRCDIGLASRNLKAEETASGLTE
ncbi:MAG: substrate-binding domain-containing protein, partial [Lachnospiraceae bacterium]|nr:substrate-binding domain-containing protein [Lachnospiraceae bacterium]